jgi:UDP-glucuronate 4-epimerase
MPTVLVTGAAGFIGFHVTRALLELGFTVVGIDNLNDYYDVRLKKDRLSLIQDHPSFHFHLLDLAEPGKLELLMEAYQVDKVIHLSAQAGVRYSLDNPLAYIQSNVTGFTNVLEACRKHAIRHLIYASSSSVYGANTKQPSSAGDSTDHPVSIYAATKKSNELLAHLYGLPTTGLRLFTAYGPWGRPDMAYFSFTRRILADEPIRLFNYGNMKRDFTYIDDIVQGILLVIDRPPIVQEHWDRSQPKPDSSYAPYRIYNIGHHQPVSLLDFVRTLENLLGRKAILEFAPMQSGDVYETNADIEPLYREVGYVPEISLETGLKQFVEWYRGYYK